MSIAELTDTKIESSEREEQEKEPRSRKVRKNPICAHLGAPEPAPEPLGDLPTDAPLAPPASTGAPKTIRINTVP
jgi:hypothetical protein